MQAHRKIIYKLVMAISMKAMNEMGWIENEPFHSQIHQKE